MDKCVCVCRGLLERVLDNESDAAFNPLLLDCKMWCNAQVQLSQHPHTKRPTALPPAFKSKTGILSTWQDQAWHRIPHWDTEQGLLSRLTFSFFPSIDIRGVDTSKSYKAPGTQEEEKLPLLGKGRTHSLKAAVLCWFKCSFRYSICQS